MKSYARYHWMYADIGNTRKCLAEQEQCRASYDAPFPTITGKQDHHVKHTLHPRPEMARVLTICERKRLQSMPDRLRLEVRSQAAVLTPRCLFACYAC